VEDLGELESMSNDEDGDCAGHLAPLPPEVPTLPEAAVQRPELIDALSEKVLRKAGGGSATCSVTAPPRQSSRHSGTDCNTTTANGMGGVGKTMLAAAFVRDVRVQSAFDRICWVSVGQEPDISKLQQALYQQLVNRPLPEAAKTEEQLALGELKKEAEDLSVLLVLDDIWVAEHAVPLNFVHPSAPTSAVVVTTRIKSLLNNAAEVQCALLSKEASLEMLLRTGGREDLLDAPPPAALEAIELCGRLPLALGIAGGIVAALGDSWQESCKGGECVLMSAHERATKEEL
jgi:hypothetical protein